MVVRWVGASVLVLVYTLWDYWWEVPMVVSLAFAMVIDWEAVTANPRVAVWVQSSV